jgi:phosphoserine phosphatase
VSHESLLESWSDGDARGAIVDFVQRVSGDGPDAVPIEERVAVFDNDGTLWTEKPLLPYLHYVLLRWAEAVKADPSLGEKEPYASAVSGDPRWLGAAIEKHYLGDDSDLKVIIGALLKTTAGVSVEDYGSLVTEFFETTKHKTLDRPYSEVVYQPMVELLRYLEANDFTCYIVSGGERDFMRPMTVGSYGIPPERVVGSAVGLTYGDGEVRYGESFGFLDDGPEKPIRIWTRIGRRPIFAAGNANGDIEMLQYVQKHPLSLSLLVHHDDDTDRGDIPYEKGVEKALGLANDGEFVAVSVKNDWTSVFPAHSA